MTTLLLLSGCFSQTVVFPGDLAPTGAPAPTPVPDTAGSRDTGTTGATGPTDEGTPPDTGPDATALTDVPFAILWGAAPGRRLGRGLTVADTDGDGRLELVLVGNVPAGTPERRGSALFVVERVSAGEQRIGLPGRALRGVAADGEVSLTRLAGFDGPGDDAVALVAPGLRAPVRVYEGGEGPFGAAALSARYDLEDIDTHTVSAATSVGDTDGDGVAELGLVVRTWARTQPTGGAWTSIGNVSQAFVLPVAPGNTHTSAHDAAYSAADEVGFDRLLPAGDTDGDGLDDVLLAGTELSLLPGPLPPAGLGGGLDGVPRWQVGHLWSGAVARAGDLDGDGAEDLVVGRPADTVDARGAAWFLHPGTSLPATLDDTTPFLTGAGPTDGVGAAVAPAGDFDGDGDPDVWVGSEGGGAALVDGTGAVLLRVDPGSPGAGRVLVGGLDVTGDGAADLVMADPEAGPDGEVATGAVWVWAGVR